MWLFLEFFTREINNRAPTWLLVFVGLEASHAEFEMFGAEINESGRGLLSGYVLAPFVV
jgi:hypothetical protein